MLKRNTTKCNFSKKMFIIGQSKKIMLQVSSAVPSTSLCYVQLSSAKAKTDQIYKYFYSRCKCFLVQFAHQMPTKYEI